ncbi:methylenetetrahydrofolate reductase 1, partial [Tanacetum coccineum]
MRALIEVSSDKELKDEVIMAIPKGVEENASHTLDKPIHVMSENEDGFTMVTNKRSKGKGASQNKNVGGFKVNNNKNLSLAGQDDTYKAAVGESSNNGSKLKILFEKLDEITTVVDPNSGMGEDDYFKKVDIQDTLYTKEIDSEVEEVYVEPRPNKPNIKGASTPSNDVSNSLLTDVCSRAIYLLSVALNLEDYLVGPSCLNSTMNDFKACVNKIEVMNINSTGLHYTWNQKPRSGGGVLKKLDRIMGNLKFVESFPGAYGVFQPYHLSDHSPVFLGTSMECEDFDSQGLFINRISNYTALNMVRNITNEEIKTAMFGIGDDRVPGPDGYTSAFFKKSWTIVGTDVCNAVREFFNNGKLLKEINHTFIALIPKVSTPLKVNDYRPISCCNVLYKCISKILTNRIIDGLKEVVSENQSAFIPIRRISDNILLTQELMHNYHKNRGPP